MWTSTPLLFLLLLLLAAAAAAPPPPPAAVTQVNIGVILDLGTAVGSMSLTAINLALSDFYAAHPDSSTRLHPHIRDSRADIISAAAAAVDLLVNEQVHAILGPQSSAQAAFVADLGAKAHTPVISSSANSPSLSPSRAPYFVHAAPTDAAQAPAIAAVLHAFAWRRAVVVYEDSDYINAFVPYLVDALAAVNVQVPYRRAIPVAASDDRLLAELYQLVTMQTRVFLVHASHSLAARLFVSADKAGMMGEGFVWIVTSSVASLLGSLDPNHVLSWMQGVIGVKPYIPRSREFQSFRTRWRREYMRENPNADAPDLGTYGVWAYDAVWALAAAVESVGPEGFKLGFRLPKNRSATGLSAVGVSRSGDRLMATVLKTRFNGLGGEFRIAGGQRNVTAFQVVNVEGERKREIGYWTPIRGLSRRLVVGGGGGAYSAERKGLGVVIWPGESTTVPRGWEQPTSGKKLRIAVPGSVEPGFRAFLSADVDPATKKTVASGFVVEVFEAAVAQLPYALQFEYVAWQNHVGNKPVDYNFLVQEVALGKYDAVVGDVTITANRSMFVDFTLPYTMSGISMVAPATGERSDNAWIFLKPLTTDLWLVSCAFFIFTGAVVWILEHRINEEFRGPPSNQLGTVFYFAFSTLVFAHREAVVSNLSRTVVVIWVFVVLILQSSYIASLTSMLTVQKLQPTVTNFDELKRNGEYIGYLNDSFVSGHLLKMGFDKSKLRPYRSPEEYATAFSKGSKNGGVAAIIDELPYLKVFLKNHCDNYTMAGQTYKTGGFGFVFPKGSPLVPDLSRAILNITEGDKMGEIEKRWFGDQTTCPNNQNSISSNSLNFRSFSGLFLITGIASLLSLAIYFVSFLYKHRHILNDAASDGSISWRLRSMARQFDQKDLSCHTFRKGEQKDASKLSPRTTSSFTNSLESPSSISIHTYEKETP